jgi:hypothetical protein
MRMLFACQFRNLSAAHRGSCAESGLNLRIRLNNLLFCNRVDSCYRRCYSIPCYKRGRFFCDLPACCGCRASHS